jgi:FkbM family methyltransferase
MNAPVMKRPLPFVLAATDHGSLIVNRLDYRLTGESSGFGVGYELLTQASFDMEEVSFAVTMLSWRREFHGDAVFVVDCGANIGVHTVQWARHMTGWGHVLAIEAQERIFYALAGNIALNNCFNARALNIAAGDSDGTMLIPQPDYTKPGSFGSLELIKSAGTEYIGQDINYAPDAMKSVPVQRIDSLVGDARVDFIKIDVEGMEVPVLNGASEAIRRHKPYIFVEYTKSGGERLIALLQGIGYKHWYFHNNLFAVPADDPCVARLPGGGS